MSDCVYMALLIVGFILLLICIAYYFVKWKIDMIRDDIVEKINNIISIISIDAKPYINQKKNQIIKKIFNGEVEELK